MLPSLPPPQEIFFFSRRRRHTRWPRDWSSDVCSSDLTLERSGKREGCRERCRPGRPAPATPPAGEAEIGRASCRERVWRCVNVVILKKKNNWSDKCGVKYIKITTETKDRKTERRSEFS